MTGRSGSTLSSRPSLTARGVAARVLIRVEKERAFAAAALEAELSRAGQLDVRDRALATELVYGALRVAPWLEARLAPFAPRGTARLDAVVRSYMILSAYQLFFMRVPAFAAVNEAVQAVRDARGPRVGGFANAVLRRVAEQAIAMRDDAGGRDVDERSRLEAAVLESTPAWLREALERSLGSAGARGFLSMSVDSPAIGLRIEHALETGSEREAARDARDEWVSRLRAAAPEASIERGRSSPLAILVRGGGKPQSLPGFAEGAWSIQEEGSQLAGLACGARAGDVVLDACAGRGNKTALLARGVGASGAVDACDASPSKLERLEEELARVGLRSRATFAVDWTVGSGEVTGVYDRVLVDAPCSGVGTLRRRPEIALRREPQDLSNLASVQLAIAKRAAAHVRPGGWLVYVVCSVLREECEGVVEPLLKSLPDFALAAPGERLLPHVHGTDGYFIARLIRR